MGTLLGLLGITAMKWVPGGALDPRGGEPASHFADMAEALRNPNLADYLQGMGGVMVGSVLLTSFLPLYLRERLGLSGWMDEPGGQELNKYSEPFLARNRYKRRYSR